MAFDLFRCPICHKKYDNDQQTPKIIAKCGSTICFECLTKTLKKNKGSLTCPLHSEKKEPLLWTEAEKFASNLLILQQLPESNPKILSCSQHKSKLKFVCIQDEVFLCKYCIQSKDHKAHPVYHINDIKSLAITKKQQLENIVSDLAPSAQQTTLRKTIIEKFDLLKKFLLWKQTEVLSEVNKQVLQAKSKLRLQKQNLEDQINIQINHLSQKELNSNFFEALKGDLALTFPLNSQAEQALKLQQEVTETQVAEINEMRRAIQGIQTIFEPLRIEERKIGIRQKEESHESSQKEEEKNFFYPHPTQKELNIKIAYNNLYTSLTPFLKHSDHPFQSQTFESFLDILNSMNSSEKILLNLCSIRLNNDYLLILQKLWKTLSSRVLELAVDLSNPNLTDDDLLNYCSSPFWTGFQFRAGEKILSLNFDLSGCKTLTSSLNKFPDYLPKMPNLKKLTINLSRTKADNLMAGALINKEIISNNSLEFLSLDFSFSSVDEEGLNTLIKHLRPLTNQLKALEIDARQVNSEVQKMTSYSLKELSKMKPLEVFVFHVGGCKKLENIKEQLFVDPQINFANLTQIIIDLSETKGVNEFVQNFNLNFLSSCGNNLKILHLEMAMSDIQLTFLAPIFSKSIFAQGLIDFNLNIGSTIIGNEFLTNLESAFLQNMQKIEKFILKTIHSQINSMGRRGLHRTLTQLSKSHILSLKKIDVKSDKNDKEPKSHEIDKSIQNKQQQLLDKINSKKSKKTRNQKVPKSERSQNLNLNINSKILVFDK